MWIILYLILLIGDGYKFLRYILIILKVQFQKGFKKLDLIKYYYWIRAMDMIAINRY